MFLLGQLFTSGSRLFIAAIAVSVIIFGKIEFTFIFCSIIILGLISTFYTMMGGIKGLLYIDTFQTLLMTFTGVVALVMVYCSLEGFSFADIWEQLTTGGMVKVPGADAALLADGTLQGWEPSSKVKMFDWSLDFSKPYTIIGGMIGIAFFKIAQYTTDQEFVQRQLSCKSVKKAGSSLVWSQLLAIPIVLTFLCIGLLLWVKFINDPHIDGEISAGFFKDARDVFPQYIKNHIPAGVRGLMITGLLAAALSSFNSAINAMASSFVDDLYLPIRKELGRAIKSDKEQISSSRWMAGLMGVLLTAFAIITAIMQEASGLNLVDFATGVMCFAYGGMIGVFLTAIFSKRGNSKSVIAAIIIGALIVIPLMFQKQFFGHTYIAWSWWCPIAGVISTLVCLAGKPKEIAKN